MKYGILFFLLIGLAGVAHAQEASEGERQAALDLLEAMDTQRTFEASMEAMIKMQTQQNPAAASLEPIMRAFFAEHLAWEQIEPDYVALYTDLYTEDELRKMIDFYQTDVGRKMVEVMPEMAVRSQQITQRHIQEHAGELQQKIMEEMQKQDQ